MDDDGSSRTARHGPRRIAGQRVHAGVTRMHKPHPSTFPTTSDGYRTEIAGISVVEIAQRFGTPTFVYDAATIAERVRSLGRFDVVRYAQKACSNIAVLDLVRREGALVDATSAGEVHRAFAAGYS